MDLMSELASGVFRIKGSRSNMYLVKDPGPVLIDAGMPGDETRVLQTLHELGIDLRYLHAIFVTHAHLDHIGGLAVVKAATGATIVAGLPEKEYIEGRRMLCSMPREGAAGRLFKSLLYVLEKYIQKYRPVQLDRAFAEPPEGPTAIDGFEVLATPGHTMGSLSFYLPSCKALFTGDALTGSPEPRLPLRAGCADYALALASVRRMAQLDVDICCFGHGDPITAGAGDLLKQLAKQSEQVR